MNTRRRDRIFTLIGLLTYVGAILVLAILSGHVVAAYRIRHLRSVPHKIIYETWQHDNWELFVVDADGSNAINVTRTPTVNELYPHATPDGTKVVFCVDEGEGDSKCRSVWYMNMDGSQRTLVATHARYPCWKSDGSAIAYLPDEFQEFHVVDYGTKGLMIYDLRTREHRPHPNPALEHLFNLCWSADSRWFVASVHAGMGWGHAIVAFEAEGTRVFDLHLPGCRPDLSPDGRKICWGASEYSICVADLDLSGPEPKATNCREVAASVALNKVYHADWSPDGRFIAFSTGPPNGHKRLGMVCEVVGVEAPGWNIGVADASGPSGQVLITRQGGSYKEPDWVPVSAP